MMTLIQILLFQQNILALKTIDDMKQYGFSPLRPELAGQIQKGDIIVAGRTLDVVLPENRHRKLSKHWEFSV